MHMTIREMIGIEISALISTMFFVIMLVGYSQLGIFSPNDSITTAEIIMVPLLILASCSLTIGLFHLWMEACSLLDDFINFAQRLKSAVAVSHPLKCFVSWGFISSDW